MAPTIKFNIADKSTVSKTTPELIIKMDFAADAGLKSIAYTGGYGGATSDLQNQKPPLKSAEMKMHFYCPFYPVGDYKVTATAIDTTGAEVRAVITLHLVA